MGAQQPHDSSSNTAASVFAWMLNVSSSVAIVVVNKVLMDQRGSYRFTFGEFHCILEIVGEWHNRAQPVLQESAASTCTHVEASTCTPI
jgi:hypothetical protein